MQCSFAFTCRNAFFTSKEAESIRQWEMAIHQSLDCPSVKTSASNQQFSAYLMKKYEAFALACDGNPKSKETVKCVGLQDASATEKVWVFNSTVHVTADGTVMDPDDSPFIWLGKYSRTRKSLQAATVDEQMAARVPREMSRKKALRNLVKHLKITYEGNFPAAMITLGAQLLSVHYEAINNAGYSVPASILCGDVSHGKSLATKAALSMLGTQHNYFLTSISDTKSTRVTSTTTLGIVIDDPTNVKEIAEKIICTILREAFPPAVQIRTRRDVPS